MGSLNLLADRLSLRVELEDSLTIVEKGDPSFFRKPSEFSVRIRIEDGHNRIAVLQRSPSRPGPGVHRLRCNVAQSVALLVAASILGQASLPAREPITTPDTKIPLKQFPKDIAKNFVRIWSGDNLVPLLAGAAATAGGRPADDNITNFFRDGTRWDGFGGPGRQIGKSQLLGPAIGLSFLVSRATQNLEYQQFTYSLAQGFILTNTLTGGLKAATHRTRPDGTNTVSFPSGHTSNSFLWATVVSRHYGWKAGLPAYVVAGYVGASRLKNRKHHLTDVLAGATLGYIVGRTVTRKRDGKQRRVQLGVTVPPGGGAALSIGIRVK